MSTLVVLCNEAYLNQPLAFEHTGERDMVESAFDDAMRLPEGADLQRVTALLSGTVLVAGEDYVVMDEEDYHRSHRHTPPAEPWESSDGWRG
jgi:hypothetical protein